MKRVLIVVDMQKDFVDGALGTAEAQAIVGNVCEKVSNFDGDIVVTFDTHEKDYLETQEGKRLPVAHCIENTDGWKLNPEVEMAINDKFMNSPCHMEAFLKPTFGSVKMVEYLLEVDAKEHIDEIVLIGLCTDICVVSNAMLLKANFLDTDIVVDASCCAGVTPETHEAALQTMKMCQIEIINHG